ncbi:polysaccharide biosynthesis protein [Paenibacillus physcomitrellae]|uniref:UDP-N-acetylglucosamine 4,6-dehydratase n=1 Tax=Paenibacillus physcomitrellae TaxID=1619311 RepID=A0ABQ1FXJ5_9BACL|nr:polysaccharide biosynthesis protein [Paenibacillus physcomitrellae]GGA31668.1 UDP-N-acetylglucosamine 4,6-dehydratase [Paenibacillus physcomitrellae]
MFKGQKILITGGTGSWGQKLTEVLLEQEPSEIRILSRNEYAQINMQRDFNYDPRLRFVIGDIRDYLAVEEASRGVNVIFHLAALKHVPVCEVQPEEAFKTNVLGTENIIRAAISNQVLKVIDVSTDKAVDPINVYGMTKALGEKMMIRANDLSEHTRFVCIRGGNVLGTSGSVVPLFLRQIKEGKKLTITDKDMTRFFLTREEALRLLLKAAEASAGGETFVMKMKACKIIDLAEVMLKQAGRDPRDYKLTGIRAGEKLHEVLISPFESPRTYEYNEQYYVILPQEADPLLAGRYSHLTPVSFSQYRSDQKLLDQQEIAEFLQAGGFIS